MTHTDTNFNTRHGQPIVMLSAHFDPATIAVDLDAGTISHRSDFDGATVVYRLPAADASRGWLTNRVTQLDPAIRYRFDCVQDYYAAPEMIKFVACGFVEA